jgi:drug/metabolite transporter (DMT)-like permease
MTPQNARFAFPAMLTGSAALAFGPWLVRLADTGPIATGFWRLALATLPLLLLARLFAPSPTAARPIGGRRGLVLGALAGLFFALDLAVWHLGIMRTTLANATLLANAATFLLPLYGFVVLRQRPSPPALLALACAAGGMALLLGRSAEVSPRHFAGDMLCLVAAIFYTAYLLVIDRLRGQVAAMPLIAMATGFGAAALLPMALAAPGDFWPANWTPLLILALGSQVFGQGLIVYAVGHLRPIVVGLALLIQPAISAAVGALRFGEIPGLPELAGAVLVAAALILVRWQRPVAEPA